MGDYDYERLRVNLNAALASLEHLEISEDVIEINDSLRCTAGGYGDVYRATLKGPSNSATRLVAVKELRAVGDDVTRIRIAIRLARELRIWGRLKHQNVLELIGYNLNPQMTTARFISPFMTHGNIEEYLDNTHSLVTDALRTKLLADVLNGLVYLHSSSPPICHADIKPGNVLITDRVEAVLCDFGLARLVDGLPSGLTTTKTTKGSIRYMSPELLDEDPRHTLYSDIWAYGCLVLKVMTGSLPYSSRRSDQQVLLALALKQPPASSPDMELQDEMLKMLLTRCWDINPSERPLASTCLSYLTKPIPDELQLHEVEKARAASEIRQLTSSSVLARDAFRSDLDFFQQTIASLGQEDIVDPNILSIRNAGTVPGAVEYPEQLHDASASLGDWTEKEKEIFMDQLAINGEQFGKIAAHLPNKTAEQCAQFQYPFKHSLVDDGKVVNRKKYERGQARRNIADHQRGNARFTDIRTTSGEATPAGSRSGSPNNTDIKRRVPVPRRGGRPPANNGLAEPRTRPISDAARGHRGSPEGDVEMASNAASGEEDSSPKHDGEARSATEGGQQMDKPRQSAIGKKKEPKKGRPSSNWWKLERKVYLEQLALHGKSWDVIAQEVKTKTPAQCRNFYNANEKGMELDKIIEAWEAQNRESLTPTEQTPAAAPTSPTTGVSAPAANSTADNVTTSTSVTTTTGSSNQLTTATLTDLDLEQVPPELKKEGSDWFAIFNSQAQRKLDISLTLSLPHESVVCCVRFSADGKFLATGCNRTAQIYDTKTGVKICTLSNDTVTKSGALYIRSVRFSPDGKLLATGAEDKLIRIWDIASRTIRQVFRGHHQEVYSLDFSRDGRIIASGSGDKTVRVWNMETGAHQTLSIREPDNVDAGVTSVAISPDSQLVAAGSLDTVVRIWDVTTGNLIERLRGHWNSVYSVAFTPDGNGLVSGSLDKTLKYWDLSPLFRNPNLMQSLSRGGSVASGQQPVTNEGGEKGSTCSVTFSGHKASIAN
ncbi:general transcription repressor [Tulasnella sp. 424]|nr:general transcription repressor [Tulasnella sp. 424]